MSPKKQDNLSPAVHTAIGGFAGVIEVCIMQPTVAIKNALQEGRPLPANPAAYYRGLLVNGASVAPITAIQFGAHRSLEKTFAAANNGELSEGLQVAAAAIAGASSSTVGCPAELLMIQQQKSGNSLFATASHYVSTHGFRKLYRGMMLNLLISAKRRKLGGLTWSAYNLPSLVTTASRDGIFTAHYLGLTPIVQAYLNESPSFEKLPGTARFCLGGIACGSFAAVVTQPIDTLKTRMQAFVEVERQPEYTSIGTTARHLIQTRGLQSLWSGLLPRLIRLSGATVILQVIKTQLVSVLDPEDK